MVTYVIDYMMLKGWFGNSLLTNIYLAHRPWKPTLKPYMAAARSSSQLQEAATYQLEHLRAV